MGKKKDNDALRLDAMLDEAEQWRKEQHERLAKANADKLQRIYDAAIKELEEAISDIQQVVGSTHIFLLINGRMVRAVPTELRLDADSWGISSASVQLALQPAFPPGWTQG